MTASPKALRASSTALSQDCTSADDGSPANASRAISNKLKADS
jgi:hypothetical protein